MMVSKEITILEHTVTFNEDIRDCIRQTTNLNTWATFKTFFHRFHREQRRAVTTAGKGGYTAAVYIIYGALPHLLEEHHKLIYDLNTIIQVM